MLFEIEFTGDKGLFELSKEYTAYPDENEVLIQDGLKYRVLESEPQVYLQEDDDDGDGSEQTRKSGSHSYHFIRLQHPPRRFNPISGRMSIVTSSTTNSSLS